MELAAYGTIQQAINAASNGDVIRVSNGVYFENVDIIGRSLTIEGDYNSSCTATGGGTTRIEGSLKTDNTFSLSSSTITLATWRLSGAVVPPVVGFKHSVAARSL